MTFQELIENAVLDAHGLLDEPERVEFERRLTASSPQIQAMVRRAQTRLTDLTDLLPEVEPPVSLRQAVIERVREAMAAELLTPGAASDHRSGLELIPSRRVSPMWRAGAMASMAAVVAMAFALVQLYQEFNAYEDTIQHNAMLDEIKHAFGSRYVNDVLFDAQTQQVIFTPATRADGSLATNAEAAIFINPDWGIVRLFCRNLDVDRGQSYRLALIDDQGRIVESLYTFEPTGGLNAREIPLDVQRIRRNDATLALIESPPPGSAPGTEWGHPILHGTL